MNEINRGDADNFADCCTAFDVLGVFVGKSLLSMQACMFAGSAFDPKMSRLSSCCALFNHHAKGVHCVSKHQAKAQSCVSSYASLEIARCVGINSVTHPEANTIRERLNIEATTHKAKARCMLSRPTALGVHCGHR